MGHQRAVTLETQLKRFREERSLRDEDMIQLSEIVRQLEQEQLNTTIAHTAVVQLLHAERELNAEISVRAQNSYTEFMAERACRSLLFSAGARFYVSLALSPITK